MNHFEHALARRRQRARLARQTTAPWSPTTRRCRCRSICQVPTRAALSVKRSRSSFSCSARATRSRSVMSATTLSGHRVEGATPAGRSRRCDRCRLDASSRRPQPLQWRRSFRPAAGSRGWSGRGPGSRWQCATRKPKHDHALKKLPRRRQDRRVGNSTRISNGVSRIGATAPIRRRPSRS